MTDQWEECTVFGRGGREQSVIDRRALLTRAGGVAALAALGRRQPAAAWNASGGGHLRVAIAGEPPAIADAMFATAPITGMIAQHIFEGLFAFDIGFNPRPMLLDDFAVSQDGLAFSGKIRQGARFHDGSGVTGADVVASLHRWRRINGRGRLIARRLREIAAPDATTIRMTFDQPTGILPSFLARPEAFIMPAAVAQAADQSQIPARHLVGTGPFRFAEHRAGQHLRVVRFADYQPRGEEPDGLAGKRVPLLDTLDFVPVPDAAARVAGLVAGEFQVADSLPPALCDRLTAEPSVMALTVKPYYWYCPHFNKARGLFTNPLARQAVQLCFRQSDAILAGFERNEFVRVDPSICGEETPWYSAAGAEAYDRPDPEKAKALLRMAGYQGETVRWLATNESAYNLQMSGFISKKMEAIGMKIELIVSDWSTLVQRRADRDGCQIFLTGHSQYSHPAAQPFNDASWPGFWDDREKDAVVERMVAATDPARLSAAIDDYTRLIWRQMPFVKCGDAFLLRGIRNGVTGYQNLSDWSFWNVSVSSR